MSQKISIVCINNYMLYILKVKKKKKRFPLTIITQDQTLCMWKFFFDVPSLQLIADDCGQMCRQREPKHVKLLLLDTSRAKECGNAYYSQVYTRQQILNQQATFELCIKWYSFQSEVFVSGKLARNKNKKRSPFSLYRNFRKEVIIYLCKTVCNKAMKAKLPIIQTFTWKN